MRKIKKGNVIYLIKEREGTLNLRCVICGRVKNEDDILSVNGKLECKCGSHTFGVLCDIEQL